MIHLLTLIIVLKMLLVLPVAITLKILMIQPNYASIRSHFAFGLSLAKLLAENDGHEVHLLVPINDDNDKMSDKNDEQRLHVRYFMAKNGHGGGIPKAGGNQNGTRPKDMTFIEIATNATLMDALSDEKFDVGIAEAFMMSEYTLAIFHFLRIPVTIATSAMPISPHHFYLLGLLSKMASANVPAASGLPMRPNKPTRDNIELSQKRRQIGTIIGDHHSAQMESRATEIWTDYVESTLERIKEHIEMDTLYQQLAENYAFDFFPGWDELFRQCRFFLVNSQPEVDFDQYKSVNGVEKVKFIGGFNLRAAASNGQQLDKKILRIFDDKKGIVLVSFGTVVDTANAEFAPLIAALKGAIKIFPDFLFVWKLSKGDTNIQKLSNELSNVYTTDWADQQRILAHPKTMAFVSHCGMNSVLEGVYYGQPIVCVPFFGDLYYNAESLARQHIGLVVDRELDQETVQQHLIVALAKALGLNDERCQQSDNASSYDEQIDLDTVKAISAFIRQKNISNVISEAFHVIEDELGTNDQIKEFSLISNLIKNAVAAPSDEPGWPELII